MIIQENYSLKNHNSFGIDVKTRFFASFNQPEDLQKIIIDQRIIGLPVLILGGGTNFLFTRDFNGLVLQPAIKGYHRFDEDEDEDDDFVNVKVGAGEVWDDFVSWCVINNYCGVENLSFIPGHVGASPVQNIGAYGVEVKDTIHSVEGIDINTFKTKVFSNADCKFEYRNSVFKNRYKGQYIITNVVFRLNKKHEFITHYGNIKEELNNYHEVTLKSIRDVIINIRKKKLPDPEDIGNAGSFFKNPIVGIEKANALKDVYPDIPTYDSGKGKVKLAAGWLIDKCGWKGRRVGDAGVHKDQALVLVNFGKASGKDILDLSLAVKKSVAETFHVDLESEVNIV